MRTAMLLLLVAVVSAAGPNEASEVEVNTTGGFRAALVTSTINTVVLMGDVQLSAAQFPHVLLTRAVRVVGAGANGPGEAPAQTLAFSNSSDPFISVGRGGRLVLHRLLLAQWASDTALPLTAVTDVAPIGALALAAADDAEISLSDCWLLLQEPVTAVGARMPFWARANPGWLRPATAPAAVAYSSHGVLSVPQLTSAYYGGNSSVQLDHVLVVVDLLACLDPSMGETLAWDSATLAAALEDVRVARLLVFQNLTMAAEQFANGAAPPLSHGVRVAGCRGAQLSFGSHDSALTLAAGGTLVLEGLTLADVTPSLHSALAGSQHSHRRLLDVVGDSGGQNQQQQQHRRLLDGVGGSGSQHQQQQQHRRVLALEGGGGIGGGGEQRQRGLRASDDGSAAEPSGGRTCAGADSVLLGAVCTLPGSTLVVRDTVVFVQHPSMLQLQLLAYPEPADAQLQLQADEEAGFSIETWDVTAVQWAVLAAGGEEQPPPVAGTLEVLNVTIRQHVSPCFPSSSKVPTVQVASSDELLAALRAQHTHIQLVADITLDPRTWPQPLPAGSSRLNPNGVNISSQVELRACSSGEGTSPARFTLDLSGLVSVVNVLGGACLTISGDVMLVGSAPDPSLGGLWMLPSAVALAPGGACDLSGIIVNGGVDVADGGPLFNRGSELWRGLLAPAPGSWMNISSNRVYLYRYTFNRGLWGANSSISGGATYNFWDTLVVWQQPSAAAAPASPMPAPPASRVPLAAVLSPAIVCGVLLLAGAVAAGWWAHHLALGRHPRGGQQQRDDEQCYVSVKLSELPPAALAALANLSGSCRNDACGGSADGGGGGGGTGGGGAGTGAGGGGAGGVDSVATAIAAFAAGGGACAGAGAGALVGAHLAALASATPPASVHGGDGGGGSGVAAPDSAAPLPTTNCGSPCISSGAPPGAVPGSLAAGAIEQVRRSLGAPGREAAADSLQLECLLGAGTFGKVYRGNWKGTLVAVKTLVFPASMSGQEKRERMAIMETAISSCLSHPNVVQMYTYYVLPVAELPLSSSAPTDTAARFLQHDDSYLSESMLHRTTSSGTPPDGTQGWEVQLVFEYCDRGSLRDLLSVRGSPNSPPQLHDLAAILDTALDVAQAMRHLHSENIIHSDLKARNILLKSTGSVATSSATGASSGEALPSSAAAAHRDNRGFVAKVADFGLSLRLDPSVQHVSGVYQGTLTHMAPEVMLHGQVSRASDVYAFGILLWELFTAGHAFKGVPRALIGHEVAHRQQRPRFPSDAPFGLQLLACRCWESDPSIRPTFEEIQQELLRLRARLVPGAPQSASLPSSLQPNSSRLLQGGTGANSGPLPLPLLPTHQLVGSHVCFLHGSSSDSAASTGSRTPADGELDWDAGFSASSSGADSAGGRDEGGSRAAGGSGTEWRRRRRCSGSGGGGPSAGGTGGGGGTHSAARSFYLSQQDSSLMAALDGSSEQSSSDGGSDGGGGSSGVERGGDGDGGGAAVLPHWSRPSSQQPLPTLSQSLFVGAVAREAAPPAQAPAMVLGSISSHSTTVGSPPHVRSAAPPAPTPSAAHSARSTLEGGDGASRGSSAAPQTHLTPDPEGMHGRRVNHRTVASLVGAGAVPHALDGGLHAAAVCGGAHQGALAGAAQGAVRAEAAMPTAAAMQAAPPLPCRSTDAACSAALAPPPPPPPHPLPRRPHNYDGLHAPSSWHGGPAGAHAPTARRHHHSSSSALQGQELQAQQLQQILMAAALQPPVLLPPPPQQHPQE